MKSKVIKIFLTILIGSVVILTATQVNAAEELDLTNSLSVNNSSAENTKNTNSNISNTNTNTNNSLISNVNTNNNVNTNSSSYNNTNLPKTGIEDAMPVAVLVVIFGISAVYAYKKISDYKNI